MINWLARASKWVYVGGFGGALRFFKGAELRVRWPRVFIGQPESRGSPVTKGLVPLLKPIVTTRWVLTG
jgi:hypothetical protein